VTQEFEAFYRLYRLYVHGLCRQRLRQVGDICELESLVWMDALRNFAQFQQGEPRRLLYRLVSWRANDLYRKRQRAQEPTEATALEDDAIAHWFTDGRIHEPQTELQMTLQKLLAKESSEDRRLVFGRCIEGMTWEELASRHRIHRNTAQNRVDGLLKRMRKQLKETV